MKHVFFAFSALALLGACADGGPGETTTPYSAQTYAAPGYAGTTTAPAAAPVMAQVAAPAAAPVAPVATTVPPVAASYPAASASALRSITASRYIGFSLWDTEGGFEKQIARKANRACDSRPYREIQRIPGERVTYHRSGAYTTYQHYTITLQCL